MENKCSRQTQCQNSNDTSTVRWTQNSPECLVAIVTPNQFVLDTPGLVSSNRLVAIACSLYKYANYYWLLVKHDIVLV